MIFIVFKFLKYSICLCFQKTTDIDLVDWNNWGDDKPKECQEEENQEIPAAELFKDMEPTINKAKVVRTLPVFFLIKY